MFERISNGWELAKRSLQVLRLDKELLLFPLLSGISCLAVMASFALPLWNSPYANVVLEDRRLPDDPLAYVILFGFYLANYFVIVFFNSALIACAIIRFHGGDPTLADGLRAASARLPQIFGWALVSATVGLVLKLIESRSEKVGRFVAGLLGMAWTAVTYFVVPVLVVEKLGPIQATQRSLAILRKTWGEALAANFGITLLGFLACLLAMIPLVLGFLIGNLPAVIAGAAVTLCLVILISLVTTALHSIIVGALYLYAAEGTVPQPFDQSLLEHAFQPK